MILTFILSNFAFSQVVQKSKHDLVLKLIQEEENTINMVKNKNDSLKYRLFELMSERIKIWQQKENDIFMQKSSKGQKVSRSKIFKKTRSLYKKTLKYGLSIIKDNRNSPYVGAIYYTLALNSRDYMQDSNQYKYLKKAIQASSQGSDIHYFATTSLAEYFYNQKKYKNAVNLYKKIVKNTNDQWLTKNLLNYGWCLLKTHKFEKAITTLEKAYKLSEQDNYLNFQEQVMTGLISFYVVSKQIQRGKDFILENSNSKYDNLLSYTKKVAAKGFYQEAIKLLDELPTFIDKKNKSKEEARLALFKFDFFKQFNQKDKIFSSAITLSKIQLNDEQRKEAILKITTEVGQLQVFLKTSYDKHSQNIDQKLLSQTNDYFDILSKLDPKNQAKYYFFQGESFYSVQLYLQAIEKYKNSIDIYINSKSDLDIRKKSLEGIFSSIEFGKLTKALKLKYLEYAYLKHINLWPKSQKSQKIFPKLFSLYLNKNELSSTQNTLDKYISSFPNKKQKQQELFKVLLDKLISSKNTNLLAEKINLLNESYLSFSINTIKQTEKILANLLFDKYQLLNKTGKKDDAINGYKKIYHTAKYPKAIKADAAFNIGIIYIDLAQSKKAIKWFERSLPLFDKNEKKKRRNYLDTLALRASLLQDLLNAAQLQKLTLKEYCHSDSDKNYHSLFRAIEFDLANNYIAKALYTYKKYKKCTQKDLTPIHEKVVDHLYLHDHQREMISFIDSEKLGKKFKKKIALYYENLFWRYHNKNKGQEGLYLYRLKTLNCKSCNLFTKSFNKYISFKKDTAKYLRDSIALQKPFDVEVFNKKLNKRISTMEPLLKKAEDILALGHPEVSILVFEQMTEIISKSSDEINNLSPPVKDLVFLKQFKEQMSFVSKGIRSQVPKIKNRVNRFIKNNKLLTLKLNKSHFASEVFKISDIRAPLNTMVNTMDFKELR